MLIAHNTNMPSDDNTPETFVRINCSILQSDDDIAKCDEIAEHFENDEIDFYEAVLQIESRIGPDKTDDVIEEIMNKTD